MLLGKHDLGCVSPEVRGERSEVRDQKSEIRGQKSEGHRLCLLDLRKWLRPSGKVDQGFGLRPLCELRTPALKFFSVA